MKNIEVGPEPNHPKSTQSKPAVQYQGTALLNFFSKFRQHFGRPLVNRFAYAIGPLSVCLSVLSSLSVFNVGVLWPNGWMDQDETWQAGRPRTWYTLC